MISNQVRCVPYGSRTLTYSLGYRARGSLAITVDPSGQVSASAPVGSSPEDVDLRVRSKGRWITEKQLEYARYSRRSEPDRLYVSGSLHPYLGRRYRLQLQHAAKWSLSLQRGTFHVGGPDLQSAAQIRTVFQDWYAQRATLVFTEQLDKAIERFRSRKVVTPERVTVRKMERRWGSMTPAGRLALNPKLIEHAKPLIEYVITHELAHRIEPNHSAKFWKVLRQAMPDYKARKDQLEGRTQ